MNTAHRRRYDDLPGCVQILCEVHERRSRGPAPRDRTVVRVMVREHRGLAVRTGVVAHLLVAPSARRSGLGRRLHDVAVAEVSGRGLVPVLVVVDSGTAAHRLYERTGWSRVETSSSRGPRVHLHVHRRTTGPTEPPQSRPDEPAQPLR